MQDITLNYLYGFASGAGLVSENFDQLVKAFQEKFGEQNVRGDKANLIIYLAYAGATYKVTYRYEKGRFSVVEVSRV